MPTPSAKLRQLIDRLNGLTGPLVLADLAEAYEAVGVTLADVAEYVEENPRSYNRALVALAEQYELLVMTWLPGQQSAPHDHAGSICILQVLEGEAIEGQYRVDRNGYVDLDYEVTVRCGEITAGEDAGVHGVRNPPESRKTLVTLHCYAPPLRDFRRFVTRRPASGRPAPRPERAPTVVVVGGGFSGSMTAAQLLKSGVSLRVMLVERRGAVGEGVAYSTREKEHLLNVPAGRMSAWPEKPDDFLHWAQARDPRVQPGDFLPRMWYGEYVRETLTATAAAAAPDGRLQVVFDEVRRVARRPDGGWLVHMANGKSQTAAAVVLAVGHRPPPDPFGKRWHGPRGRFIEDPWRQFGMSVVRHDEPVVILGSGLTAIDAMLSLAHPDRTAPITIISRRGLLPHAHAVVPSTPADLAPLVDRLTSAPEGLTALALLRALRRLARQTPQADWRAIVDGLRPHTARLWQCMSVAEQRRFLAQLRPFWEVHRHRMAVGIAERYRELTDRDWVVRLAGRVVAVHADADSVRVIVARRGDQKVLEVDAKWVINCTGPAASNTARANPAVGSLLVDGWLQPDPLGLGVETGADGTALDREGREVPDLYVVGTLRKPALWESTAVPELRGQAAVVAERIVDHLAAPQLLGGASI